MNYVLIHGAGDVAWYWHLVSAELEARGHGAIAVDLPCEDEQAGWSEYADTVVNAIGARRDLVVVAQSLGGCTAPLVCARVPTELLVLVAAVVPAPGEPIAAYQRHTGYDKLGVRIDDERETFYHDVPPALADEAMRHGRRQAEALFREPWPLPAWPDVPKRFLLCRYDRVFPAAWLRGVVRERLGITPDEIDSGHCVALSHPRELTERLVAWARR
jgi:pimeloyl-ACP methyl ester carboxylesterase